MRPDSCSRLQLNERGLSLGRSYYPRFLFCCLLRPPLNRTYSCKLRETSIYHTHIVQQNRSVLPCSSSHITIVAGLNRSKGRSVSITHVGPLMRLPGFGPLDSAVAFPCGRTRDYCRLSFAPRRDPIAHSSKLQLGPDGLTSWTGLALYISGTSSLVSSPQFPFIPGWPKLLARKGRQAFWLSVLAKLWKRFEILLQCRDYSNVQMEMCSMLLCCGSMNMECMALSLNTIVMLYSQRKLDILNLETHFATYSLRQAPSRRMTCYSSSSSSTDSVLIA